MTQEGSNILALIGAKGMLAQAVREQFSERYQIRGYDLPEFDLTDGETVRRTLVALRPAVIVNCAAFTDVDGCESQFELALGVNGDGPGYLAAAAAASGALLVHFSTDYVFDGRKHTPYREEDAPAPTSAYGRSKRLGELKIQESGLKSYYILRTSWLYGPGGKNFVETILRLATEREELRIVDDQLGSPTYTRDLATALSCLIDHSADYGVYHFSNAGQCSWYGFAEKIVALASRQNLALKARRLLPIATEDYPLPATRPAFSVLEKTKYLAATGAEVPPWDEALERYLGERGVLG